jgi:hypothetical protein
MMYRLIIAIAAFWLVLGGIATYKVTSAVASAMDNTANQIAAN